MRIKHVLKKTSAEIKHVDTDTLKSAESFQGREHVNLDHVLDSSQESKSSPLTFSSMEKGSEKS